MMPSSFNLFRIVMASALAKKLATLWERHRGWGKLAILPLAFIGFLIGMMVYFLLLVVFKPRRSR